MIRTIILSRKQLYRFQIGSQETNNFATGYNYSGAWQSDYCRCITLIKRGQIGFQKIRDHNQQLDLTRYVQSYKLYLLLLTS